MASSTDTARRWNLAVRARVAHGSSVRIAQTPWSDRPDQRGYSAQPRRARGALGSICDRLPVADVGRIVQDNFPFDAAPAQRLELIEVRNRRHLGRRAAVGSCDASAQTQYEQRLAQRLQHFRGLASAHPVRNHHRNRAHIRQPGTLHFRERPRDPPDPARPIRSVGCRCGNTDIPDD